MAPNAPACSFIHASMAGSRSTAPLNRSNSVLIVAPLPAFEICGYVAALPSLRQNPPSGTVVLVHGVLLRLTPQSFITRIVRDRVGRQTLPIWLCQSCP